MTKKTTALLSIALMTSMGLSTSCSKNSEKKSQAKISSTQASLLASQGKAEEAALMYSNLGEQLLASPVGIVKAQEMFQKSLDLRTNNSKANFYSALLGPILTTKGFIKRFAVLVKDDPATKANVDKLEKKILDSGVQEFIDFALVLPEGKSAAKNAEEVRKFYRNEYVKELDNSLVKLEEIKASRFSIYLDYAKYKNDKGVSVCSVDQKGETTCNMVTNDKVKYNLDTHDVKAVSVILKTERNAMKLLYSIGLEGYEDVADKTKTLKTDKEIVEAIRSKPNLLKIDGSKDELREIFDHSEEVMNDLLDFSKLSKELCNADDRKSHLFSSICMTEEDVERVNNTLMFVVGPKSVVIGRDRNGEKVSVEINLRALIDSKVTSLQALLPSEFDSEGKAIGIKDLTFSGIIPNSDLFSKYKEVVKQNVE